MRHGSLFSGMGGFDLAAEWMNWENVFHCEFKPFNQTILKYYWPNAITYTDIRTTDFTIHRGQIDILTGGFPCQPYSQAGKRLGTEDDRHLWPEMLRAIREIQPPWVVGENVRGLINWSDGLVFEEVQADLEAEGYEVQPFLLPAAGVGAPHERYRIWFVAYSNSARARMETYRSGGQKWERPSTPKSEILRQEERKSSSEGTTEFTLDRYAPNSDSARRQERNYANFSNSEGFSFWGSPSDWSSWPTVSPVRHEYDGVSRKLVRHIRPEVYGKISERYTDEELQEVWEAIQSKEIQWQIGRLYKIYEPGILLKVLQLCQRRGEGQGELSPFSEEASKGLLRKLRKQGKLGCSSQRPELEKQFREQFGDSLPPLSHEIALATKEIQEQLEKFSKWIRNESIQAGGNAIVPQVALQIFKAIQMYEDGN